MDLIFIKKMVSGRPILCLIFRRVMQEIRKEDLIKIDDTSFEIPQSYRNDMRVPARIFANEQMLDDIVGDRSLWQLVNVSTLPGIQKYAIDARSS